MAIHKRNLVPGNYYHIYNRGNSKQKIFLDESDKNRFTQLMYLCNGTKSFHYIFLAMEKIFNFTFEKGESLTDVCAWVLMDNHFHILIYLPENSDAGNLSKFVARLSSSYLKYFNEKHNRTGGLFEGRYQSILVEEDSYLKYLFSYIHLNPLKMLDKDWKHNFLKIKKAKIYLEDYKYSSFNDLVSKHKRPENNILTNNVKVLGISNSANSLEKVFAFFTNDPRGSLR